MGAIGRGTLRMALHRISGMERRLEEADASKQIKEEFKFRLDKIGVFLIIEKTSALMQNGERGQVGSILLS
jgi:hypothetical protein